MIFTAEISFFLCTLVLGYILFIDLHGGEVSKVSIIKAVLLRGVALSTLTALHSLAIQSLGLLGKQGLHPIAGSLATIYKYLGDERNCVWWSSEKAMKMMLSLVHDKFFARDINKHLTNVMRVDIVIACIAVIFPHPVLLIYLYISYYGYKRVSGPFLNFQWDALLLESLFLSIPLSLSYSSSLDKICLWLYKVLLFRLMFGSGMVKLYGRDSSWHSDYTAMTYHFLTQPLPKLLSMFLHTQLPVTALKGFTYLTIIAEVHFPLLSLLNNYYLNALVAAGYIILQLAISGAGYFGFFNYMTILLSLALLQDEHILSFLSSLNVPHKVLDLMQEIICHAPAKHKLTVMHIIIRYVNYTVIAVVVSFVSISNSIAVVKLLQRTRRISDDENTSTAQHSSLVDSGIHFIYAYLVHNYEYMLRVFFVGNHYGLFAYMTKERNEVLIQVSTDKQNWHDIRFKYKPDSLDIAPKDIFPPYHLPRLDWLMWFLAFKTSFEAYPKWAVVLCMSILEGNQDVLDLLHSDSRSLLISLLEENALQSKEEEVESKREVQSSPPTIYLRIMFSRYEYEGRSVTILGLLKWMLSSTGVPEGKKDKNAVYWKALDSKQLLPACSLEQLYELYERLYENQSNTSEKPTVETAQQIIMRTLFRRREAKKKGDSKKD